MRKHRFTRAVIATVLGVGLLTAIGVSGASSAGAVVPCSGGTVGDYFDNQTATAYGGIGGASVVFGTAVTDMKMHTPTLCSGGTGTFAGNLIMIQNNHGGVIKLGEMYQPNASSCNRWWYQALDATGGTLVTGSGACITDNSVHSVIISYNVSTDNFGLSYDATPLYTTTFGVANWANTRLRYGTEANYTVSNVAGSAANPGSMGGVQYQYSSAGNWADSTGSFSFTATPNANPTHWASSQDHLNSNFVFWTSVVQ